MALRNGFEHRVQRIFRESLELEVEPDADVIEEGVMDSLVFVQLLVELEKEFQVSVKVEELELDDFRSVTRIARYVEARLG
jgi:acyl carrier protein